MAYRRLALQLHYDLPRGLGKRSALLVTPTDTSLCAPASTILASCLAEQLARPVLLIDLSPAKPRNDADLQEVSGRGVSDFLSNPTLRLQDLACPTTSPNVHYLPAGTSRPTSTDNLDQLLSQAESQYDFVLVVGGSVLKDPLSLAVAPWAGCVLLLVIQNETLLDDLDNAQSALGYCKARKVGMVLTTQARSGVWPL